MTDQDFYAGWALLTAQPYARWLEHDKKYEVQEQMWKRRFFNESARDWEKTVFWWIEHESTWPTIPQFVEQLTRIRGPEMQALLTGGAPIWDGCQYRQFYPGGGGIPPDDWFVRRAFRRWFGKESGQLHEFMAEESKKQPLSVEDSNAYANYMGQVERNFGMDPLKNKTWRP